MGRPLNKRFFGADSAADIKVQFHNGTKSVPGYIVKQKGSKRFVCKSALGVEAICVLVDKASTALQAGEMTISVKLDNGDLARVTKIAGHKITAGGVTMPWNFSPSTTDAAAQVEEAGVLDTETQTLVGADDFEGDDAASLAP